jgi:nucleotide-binding universal stress UspA family protein
MSIQTSSSSILVPIDFSNLSSVAIAHAVNYAKLFKCDLALIHFVEKGFLDGSAKIDLAKKEAELMLANMAEDVFSEHGIQTSISVKIGDFKDGIGEFAVEAHAKFVVMATKGIHGMQRWTGSNAIKVVLAGKTIPFVVVQELPKREIPEHVILPFSFESESRQKLGRVPALAKLFDCVFHIISEPHSDEFIKNKITINVNYAKKYLEENNCKYIVSKTLGKKSFHKEMIDFAIEKQADLIVIMSEEEHEFSEIFTGSHEQEIIANEAKIPVLVINPADSTLLSGSPVFF